jgi:hypothetical protein
VQWDDAGIVVWFFPRTKIPVDIEAEAPITTSWGRPMARIPAEQCSPARFYRNHNVIVNTALWQVVIAYFAATNVLNIDL